MSVAGVGDHYQVRFNGSEVGVVQAETTHHPGGKVFQDDIADADKAFQDVDGGFGAQIQRDAAFATVQGLEGTSPLPIQFSGVVVRIWTVQGAGRVDELGLAAIYFYNFGP